ncbi:MAG: LPS-assembly protein LptD, partial [Candidatus Nanopelagicales bacterium]|nr:LPS-assembly protein LptD [Candidatus Nanopelagicales bacterium]
MTERAVREAASPPPVARGAPGATPLGPATAAATREPAGGGQLPAAPPTPAPAAAPATRPADGPPLSLQAATTMQPPPAESDVPRPVFLAAQRLSGVLDREAVAEGEAELRKAGTVVTADRMTYWPVEDEVEGMGSVELRQGDDRISGTQARFKLEDQVGFVDQASYFIKRQPKVVSPAESEPTTGFAAPRVIAIRPGQTKVKSDMKPADALTEARGEAARIDLEGENQYRLTAATYTTCKPGREDWYLSVADLQLDYDNEVGTGSDATLRFFDVPILHSPWLSFPLNDERKSGFLTPTYGSSNSSGIEVMVPYYWNIAPNMDATFYPRLMTKRGVQLGTQFRYLNEAFGGLYRGDALYEYLPHDRLADRDRWGVALQHMQTTAAGFSGTVSYNRVSDSDYYTDLSSQITNTSRVQLLQQGTLTYAGRDWWNVTAMVQSFQTLEPDPKNPVSKPYRLLPQITVNARQPDLFSTDSSFYGQYTSFVHPEKALVEGQRIVLQPQISVPFVTPGWYVTPRVGVNLTHYSLSYPTGSPLRPGSITRTLPIFSVDSGMTFERPSVWFDREYTQTLEPRLFYLNIPYENQDDIPIFDTGLADFNFAQIFADNQFSGWDRFNNANQLTAALSSRLIDPANGAEVMRAMIGQLFYFADDKVSLPGTANRKWGSSDFLAAFSGQIWPRVYVDAALQYDPSDSQFERYTVGARYQPSPGRALNASYIYNTEASVPIKQVDLSGQWPITGRWQAVGRYNYSFLQNTP